MSFPLTNDVEPHDLPAIPANSKARRGSPWAWIAGLLILAAALVVGAIAYRPPVSNAQCMSQIAEAK